MKYTVLNHWKQFLFICLIFAALISTAAAGAWEMDTNFGNNGVYNFFTGVNNSTVRSMAVMPNAGGLGVFTLKFFDLNK